MATRIKTVEFAFPSRNTSLAANTRNNFAAITLYLPETTSRTFRSVRMTITARDNVTTATSIGNQLMGIKLGAAAFSDVDPIATSSSNSGESGSYNIERDITSYFTTNFGGGASQTCQVAYRAVGAATINISAKLYITYEYDDSDATHVKTVKIPLDSDTGALTTTLTEIGTNQIPALDSFLPETSKVYRNIWFELYYNEYTVGTANDAQLGMQVDSGTEYLTGLHESALASSLMGVHFWDQGAAPAWSTASAHAFKLRSSTITTASTFNHVGVVLCVSYEFAANSSSIINSLELLLPVISGPYTAAAADAARSALTLLISEPGTIAQVQGGVLMTYKSGGSAVNPVVKLGAGTARTYTDPAVSAMGSYFHTQRCDSGGAGGSAWTLARGFNVLYVDVYTSAGTQPSSFCPILILNYTSGNDGNGGSRHNRTLSFNGVNTQTAVTGGILSPTQTAWLPDSEGWFLNNLGIISRNHNNGTSTQALSLRVEAASGELAGDNFYDTGTWFWPQLNELSAHITTFNLETVAHAFWDRWYNDPDTTRMSLTAARRFCFNSVIHTNLAMEFKVTKHSITKATAGTIAGSAGGTVTIEAYSPRFGKIGSTSRSGNGAYSIPWYDITENVKVYARESGTLLGASDEAVAA